MNMDINDYAKEFTREIGRNVHVNLLSTEPDQVENTIFWAFRNIANANIGGSKYFVQNGQIFNATIDFKSNQVIMVRK